MGTHFRTCTGWLCTTSCWDACVWLCEGSVKSVKSNSLPWVSAPIRSDSSVSRNVRVWLLGPYASTLILAIGERHALNCHRCEEVARMAGNGERRTVGEEWRRAKGNSTPYFSEQPRHQHAWRWLRARACMLLRHQLIDRKSRIFRFPGLFGAMGGGFWRI